MTIALAITDTSSWESIVSKLWGSNDREKPEAEAQIFLGLQKESGGISATSSQGIALDPKAV